MIIDLDKVEHAMDALALSVTGREALDYLTTAIDEFRAKLGVDLNAAEFRYVMERLMAQRALDPSHALDEVAGFAFESFSKAREPQPVYPTAAFDSSRVSRMVGVNRLLPGGFVIKAGIVT